MKGKTYVGRVRALIDMTRVYEIRKRLGDRKPEATQTSTTETRYFPQDTLTERLGRLSFSEPRVAD